MYLKPPALNKGDAVAIIAPAGAVDDSRIEQCKEVLTRQGFRPIVDEDIKNRNGYLAGLNDQARANALVRAFANPEVKGVVCGRGGYGTMRILSLIDWEVLRAHPKFFCGFSDITGLHLAIRKETSMISYHGGPMPRLADNTAANDWNDESFFNAITAAGPLGTVRGAKTGPCVETLVGGVAEGILEGGNLTLLASLCGTRWQMNMNDCILLVEDISEAPYRIDRSLTQLHLSGVLQNVKGIVFGHSPTCEQGDGPDDFTLRGVIMDRLGSLGVPLTYGYPCGHSEYRATLPVGARVRMDADRGTLEFMD